MENEHDNIYYVVTNDFQKVINGGNFTIQKDTLLLLSNDEYDLEDNSIEFKLFIGNNNKEYYDEYFSLGKQFVKEHMITLDDYQQQFSHLTLNNNYFGQIPTYHGSAYFSILENGKEVDYEKIDEYTKKDGTKINAVKRKLSKTSSFISFFIDEEDYCREREFAYFSADTPVIYKKRWGEEDNNDFYPTQQHQLSIRFIQLPQMFDVIECFFNNIALNDELIKVYQDYKKLKYELDNDGWGAGDSDVYYQYVLPIRQQQKLQTTKDEIMQQIEIETAQFKTDLIAKRLNF